MPRLTCPFAKPLTHRPANGNATQIVTAPLNDSRPTFEADWGGAAGGRRICGSTGAKAA